MVRILLPLALVGFLLAGGVSLAQDPAPRLEGALTRAEDLIGRGRIEDARQALLRLHLTDPRDARIPFLLAQCELNDALKSGEAEGFEKARIWLRKADELDVTFPPMPYLWGIIGLKSGRYDDAVGGFKEALKRGFRPLDTRGNLAHALFLLGEQLAGPDKNEPEPAIAVFEEARKRFEALKNDARVLIDVRGVYRDLWMRAQSNLAALHQDAGNYPAAQKLLDELIRIEPRNPRHHYNLGLLHGEGRRWELALAKYRDALEIARGAEFVDPHLKIGYIHSQRGEEEEAERHFRLFFDVYPDDWFGHFYLGRHHQQNERYEEALRSLVRCVELDQESYASIAAVSECLFRLGRPAEGKMWQQFFKEMREKAIDKKTPDEGDREKR